MSARHNNRWLLMRRIFTGWRRTLISVGLLMVVFAGEITIHFAVFTAPTRIVAAAGLSGGSSA